MRAIHQAIRYPVATAVGVILLVLFGVIALLRLPIQLTPNVQDPVITVRTIWPGASPLEIEREIVQEQEEQLKALEGLVKMESQSNDSAGNITLTFQVSTNMDTALLRVSNRLEQVREYPDDAEKPIITSVDSSGGAIAWFVIRTREQNGFEGDISTLFDFVDDFVKPELERVPGVASSNIYGGRTHEMHVIFDPARLAARQVTLTEIATALDRENRNFSGGDFDEGKRRYIVRTIGEYESAEDVENIVVAVRNDVPVYVRDIGRAELGYRKATARVFHKGQPILAINAAKEPGANILVVMDGIQHVAGRINEAVLADAGLQMIQVYDETEYVDSAIQLVLQSLLIGAILAIIVLLIYLRSGTSTLVIAVAIPISIVGAFLGMNAFGRTLNVISLAGLAFAVGMVVDNSIVVLENIYRHRQLGKAKGEAALDGAREVWGAVLASTLTTIAVFVPIVFMQGEVGQLFGDIALAISCAVGLSLIVSITVIPSLSAKILRARPPGEPEQGFRGLWGLAGRGRNVSVTFSNAIYRMTGSVPLRVGIVVGFTLTAIGLSALLMPETEYLPVGNQNFAFGRMLPPPGYSLEEVEQLQAVITDGVRPLFEAEPGSAEARALPGGGIRTYFFVALPSFAFMGASANDGLRVSELVDAFQKANQVIPGTIFTMSQRSIFQRRRGAGRNVDIEIQGPDLERLIELGVAVYGRVTQAMPEAQAFPIPGLDLGNPEVRVVTHRRRAAELGISNRDLGFAVSALVDGTKATDFQYLGKKIDLKLMAAPSEVHRTHLLEQMPIAAPDGSLVTLGSVAEVSVVNGPLQINHTERQRTITIQVIPSKQMPVETAAEVIDREILQPLRDEGQLGGVYVARLSGTADRLAETREVLMWNLLLVLALTYLLLAALFGNFLHPLVIMFSVPLAALGGFLGLRIAGADLDMLTMLGFIILIGTVVNNAILIVHQSLNHMRQEGLESREAIRAAVRNRFRPIFMSVSTSVLGMLPLILFPGAGSELYRGLGSVVVGGLIVSTLFTLVLVPALFSLSLDARDAVVRRVTLALRGREPAADDGAR